MAKKPFVVLDAEILSSSVWSESAPVRLVWITLLILCDTDGYVGAALPGIATAAGVSLEEAELAMDRLQQPDRHSRTQANGGRRVMRGERGWQILNFRDHLDRLSSERAKSRDRVKRYRERQAERLTETRDGNGAETPGYVTVTTINREQVPGSSEKGVEGTNNEPAASPRAAAVPVVGVALVPTAQGTWSAEACDDWTAGTGGTAPGGKIGKALKPLIDRIAREKDVDFATAWGLVRRWWQRFCQSEDVKYGPQAFADNPRRVLPPKGSDSEKALAHERATKAGIKGGWIE